MFGNQKHTLTKTEKASNTYCNLLAESKTTFLHQNQSQTYYLDTQ
jgi:hypothetical protein